MQKSNRYDTKNKTNTGAFSLRIYYLFFYSFPTAARTMAIQYWKLAPWVFPAVTALFPEVQKATKREAPNGKPDLRVMSCHSCL